ncbi:flippase [Thermococcus argininiproducens]|uniref:Flippase n=1 Tax=Thermococcus argininiproducens TaxID=2866384 RepID=A0A9E7SDC0_9EURY|nr:flippase [Thermococcus argininiproducens]USH00417.1 flippase [Thermococcus argininiproducens]
MSEVNRALQRIARGAGIIFTGIIISTFFGFLNKAIIARYFSRGEYGVFNMALTVLSISLVIGTLGFGNSLPRQVAIYRERKPSQLKDLISTALFIAILTNVSLAVLLVIGADKVALLFHDERLDYPLRILGISLPFSALTYLLVAISRGFGRVREKVYFQNVTYPTVFFILILTGALLKMGFSYIFFAYVVAQGITLFLLLFDVTRIGLIKVSPSFIPSLGKELIFFSLPLMLTGILAFVMNWTDTLMLGYYLSLEVVGVYNAAAPLARMLPMFLNSAGFLYTPIASQLYAQGRIEEMGRVYQILTKWVFLLTLPIFAVMFLFPEVTINFIFGKEYLGATTALQILALGFMFHTFLGLNGLSLTVIGKPKLNLLGNLIAASLNVILNMLLIPKYGLNGAAIATAVSYFAANASRSFWLYVKSGIHPFGRNYVKPLVISFVLLGIIKSLHLRVPTIWYVIPVLMVFLMAYVFLILLSKSIDKEDIEMILAIEKRLGLDLRVVKKILKRFV